MMTTAANNYEALLTDAYTFFNARDIDAVLALMHTNVHWPNGWEGGYVEGHEAVRDYWTRQWAEINPIVTPLAFKKLAGGRIETTVQQTVKDMQGNLVFDGPVKHVYTIVNGLVSTMEIHS